MLNEYQQVFIITLTIHLIGQDCSNTLAIIAPCQEGQFKCQSDNLCISAKLICDGNTNCLDQSDEWNCNNAFKCSEKEIRCTMTGHCIDKSLVCDGSSDCIDLSDEVGCPGSRNASLAVKAYPCKWNQFYCAKDSKCIPFFRWCNNFEDCTDGSDEHDCNQRKIVSKTTLSYPCKWGEFFCGEDLKCIPMLMWCDYYEDCSDGSDELYCDQLYLAKVNATDSTTISSDWRRTNYVCNHNQFSCKQDGKCISESLRCDHTKDCHDGSDEKCCDQVCGRIKSSSAKPKIVGGKPAAPKDWPWVAALIYADRIRPFCGGTLISDIHVLTAAHCIESGKKIKVRLGEYNFADDSDNNPQDFEIEEIRKHELFNTVTYDNDIAIIKLSQAATFSEFIGPACLPPHNEMFENRIGRVAGWGTKRIFGENNDILHEVNIRAWEQNECLKAYETITENMMCGGWKNGGLDACQGDSGGPFLMHTPLNVRWFVAGIVSWGKGCALKNSPGVYTRVNNYLDWISENMTPRKPIVNPVQTTTKTPSQTASPKKNRPFDCSEVCSPTENCESGVFTIYPVADQALEVWCDLHTNGGKWTVIISRKKLSQQISFIRNWNEYKNGFGTAGTEYWIGNEVMHRLTNAKNFTLRIDAVSNELGHTWGEFKTFKVSSEDLKYVLRLEDPTTDGGIVYYGKNGLHLHNGLKFTTGDNDNDESPRGNCGQLYGAGMWYARCYNFLPTGKYGLHGNEGIKFESWSNDNPTIGYADYLQFKIRPI